MKNTLDRLAGKLKRLASGRPLFSIFIPALLWGDFCEAQAAETRRVYRPTAAQLRLEQQNRERARRIQAIRNQQAQKAKTGAVKPAAPAGKKPPAATAVPVPVVRIRYMWHQGTRFVLVQDVARYYGMKIFYYKQGLSLKSPRDTITLQYDKRLANINRTSVYLTHAPVLRGALVYLDEKDFQLVVDPVIRNAPLWKHPVKTILIDPGHGGKDQGAPGVAGLLEKNVTLSIAHKLALKLRQRGFRVFMTRINDRQLTLQQRVDMCGKLRPDLFISVHCNAVGKKTTRGIETYAVTPQGAASTSDAKPVTTASAGNSFNRNNYRLAYEVQKNLLAFTRAEDRGVRHARFFVIRHAVCPAILIETGFLTHSKEGVLLSSPSYQDLLVSGITNGVVSYMNAACVPVKSVPAARPAPAAKTAPVAKPAGKAKSAPAVKPAPPAKTVPVSKPAGKAISAPAANAAPVSKPAGKAKAAPVAGRKK